MGKGCWHGDGFGKERIMEQDFYAMMSRMKYIERWALMRNSMKENISEHSLQVSMLAHALAVIENRRHIIMQIFREHLKILRIRRQGSCF